MCSAGDPESVNTPRLLSYGTYGSRKVSALIPISYRSRSSQSPGHRYTTAVAIAHPLVSLIYSFLLPSLIIIHETLKGTWIRY